MNLTVLRKYFIEPCLGLNESLLCFLWKVKVSVTQLCLTLCDCMDCSPPGSPVHGILQASILKWVAIFFFRRSSPPRNQTQVFCIGRQILYHWASWEAQEKFIQGDNRGERLLGSPVAGTLAEQDEILTENSPPFPLCIILYAGHHGSVLC